MKIGRYLAVLGQKRFNAVRESSLRSVDNTIIKLISRVISEII